MPKLQLSRERRLTRGMLKRLHYVDAALRRKAPVNCSTIAERFEVTQRNSP